MLTPRFELSQEDDFLILVIYAPFAKVSETEFFIEGEQIRFYSKPYYLRLHLPKPVVEDHRTEAKYDVDKGCFTAKITKQNKGEVFEGLDMLTKLLTPPGETSAMSPGIEVVGNPSCEKEASESPDACGARSTLPVAEESGGEQEEEIDWYIEQELPSEEKNLLTSGAGYGFACQRFDVFTKLMSEFSEILDVQDPDMLSTKAKREQRLAHEAEHFSEDHYLADLYENDEIAGMLAFKPWWTNSDKIELSEEEKDQLLKLPRKQYLLDDDVLPCVFYSLIDILFGYAYSHRTVLGEDNVESGWTIGKLSATLSWLDTFTSVRDVQVSCFRRALTFPLYRNWDLCVKVWEDVAALFTSGRLHLLRCLLDVHKCMITSDPRYIFNDLYITDYCVWIQSADSKRIKSLAKKLAEAKLSKSDVGLELEELEHAAELVLKDSAKTDVDRITAGVSKMGVNETDTALDSDDEDESDDESDSEDSSEGDESEEEKNTHAENKGRNELSGSTTVLVMPERLL